jgi:hypothetical protein|tara:strand:- start:7134 stop:7244 length:111 start_codon:yes stop_codon:yes gene_type:complete
MISKLFEAAKVRAAAAGIQPPMPGLVVCFGGEIVFV